MAATLTAFAAISGFNGSQLDLRAPATYRILDFDANDPIFVFCILSGVVDGPALRWQSGLNPVPHT